MQSLNACNDLVFKKIFGVEKNKHLFISLINVIIGKEDQVADSKITNPYNLKRFINDKSLILDIKARGLDGKKFNIKTQVANEIDYSKRALYYWSKLYLEQLQKIHSYLLIEIINIYIEQLNHKLK